MSDVLRHTDPFWALSVVLMSLACHALRAERWRMLLRPAGDVPWVRAFSATLIGFGASMVLPLRLGEIVRPALLSRRVGIPLSTTLSSIVIERLFDILLVICCFFVVGFVYEMPPVLRQGAIALGAVAAIGFAILVVMQRRRDLAERVIRRLLGLFPPRIGEALWPIVDGLLTGLAAIGDLRTAALVLGSSIVLWVGIMFTYLLSFLALDIEVPLFAASLTTMVVVAAFVFLPQAPGFVGTWQAGCVLALGLFAVSQERAIGYSLVTWVIQMVVNIGSSAVCLAFEDVSVRDLVRESRREVPEA